MIPPKEAFSYRERVLVAPLAGGPTKQFFHVRMESAMSVKEEDDEDAISVTPFPLQVKNLLRRHNVASILIQVGTGSSHSYGRQPLDRGDATPWFSEKAGQRLDLGPSGVLVRASLRVADAFLARLHWQALLHELASERILAAPLYSIHIRRLHRHWTSTWDEENGYHEFELILPKEGAALSSEGTYNFVNAFAPCRNQSGVLHWNSPKVLSSFFLEKQSAERHSWWIQMQQQTNKTEAIITTSVTKGMQFQPHIDKSKMSRQNTISLKDIFPAATQHRRCIFVENTTLETLISSDVPLKFVDDSSSSEIGNNNAIESRELVPKYWKQHWMALLPATPVARQQETPQFSMHQMLQRPRGQSYAGRLITQVKVNPPPQSSGCPVSVELQWFLPPIVIPTWQSFRIIQEDGGAKEERSLDWRQDLDGSISVVDPISGQSTHGNNMLPMDEGSHHFHVPQWNATNTQPQTLTFVLDYRPAFLSFENFPGDANRGVEVPPARAVFVERCQGVPPAPPIHLYSNSLLLMPPVPDMSMPFNVLSMSCSLYAFVIGSLMNLLVRKSSERVARQWDPSKIPPPSKLKRVVLKIKEKVQALKGKLRKGNSVAAEEPDSTAQEEEATESKEHEKEE